MKGGDSQGFAVRHISKIITAVLVLAIVLLISAFGKFLIEFCFSFGETRADWGVAGDFLGGVLNPILSFLSLMALLSTIVLQNYEIRETRLQATKAASAQESSSAELKLQTEYIKKQAEQAVRTANTNGFLHAAGLLQSNEAVDCRKVVFDRLDRVRQNPGTSIPWRGQERAAAESVCRTMDVVAIMVKEGMVPDDLFEKNWARPICHSWEACEDIIKLRRERQSDLWNHFEWLKDRARKYMEIEP